MGKIEVTRELLKVFNLKRNVLTGGEGFCCRIIAEKVGEAGGDWIFALKRNQKNVYRTVNVVFWTTTKKDSSLYF